MSNKYFYFFLSSTSGGARGLVWWYIGTYSSQIYVIDDRDICTPDKSGDMQFLLKDNPTWCRCRGIAEHDADGSMTGDGCQDGVDGGDKNEG